MGDHPDIRAGRLSTPEYERNFDDAKPPLDRKRALVEASRCYFCHDAPCIEACPTGIDIPNFIRKISTDNVRGAALDILEPNIFGGMCARVCPTEELCEDACVRNAQENKPVKIGRLQRYATDWLMEEGIQPFEREPGTGRKVAVVGAGPAGLACAHRLSTLGHDVVVYEARPKGGGLNEYGIAAYKVLEDFAQRELGFVLALGGIDVRYGQALGQDVTLAELRRDYDAVFLGVGQAGVRALGLEGEDLAGVIAAVDYIAELRQTTELGTLPVGRNVVVIGGGNTAIDVASQSKRLGAEDVTIVYRRGPEHMSATWVEQEFAQTSGVRIRHWAQPVRLHGHNGHVKEIEFEYTQLDGEGRLMGTGDTFTMLVDVVFKAIGQVFVPDPALAGAREPLNVSGGRIVVNEDRQTSLPDVFAGGDCIPGVDLTVEAVEDGKVAAHAIDRMLHP
ncbi:MAG: NAD(P)-dependent oxidoreductase [Alphaproteobacteria bacterium]